MQKLLKFLIGALAAVAALFLAMVFTPPFHQPPIAIDYFWGVVRLAAPVLAVIFVARTKFRMRPSRRRGTSPGQEADVLAALGYDELLPAAADAIFELGQASTSMLQRRLGLGYARAARMIDQLEAAGLLSPFAGAVPRKILLTRSEWEARMAQLPPLKEAAAPAPDPVPEVAPYLDDESEWRREQPGLSRVDYALSQVDGMGGYLFEEWCASLLLRRGFEKAVVTPGSGDQGADIIAAKDGVTYAVQCKCYSRDLDNTPIQEVNAAKLFYNCHVGAVMTNRYFTEGAKALAKATGTLLWDRDYIRDWLEEDFPTAP